MQSPHDSTLARGAAQGVAQDSSSPEPTSSGASVPPPSVTHGPRRSNAYGEILDRLRDDLDDH
jgi:hypothetical protein